MFEEKGCIILCKIKLDFRANIFFFFRFPALDILNYSLLNFLKHMCITLIIYSFHFIYLVLFNILLNVSF